MKVRTMVVLLGLCLMGKVFAQPNSQCDVRLASEQATDCDNDIFYVDIQVRASSPAAAFRISDQNYRFLFDMGILANPRIEAELALSGLVVPGDGSVSVYGDHTLTGSLGPTVSYNVQLDGGDGYLIDTSWVSIGRIAFDILNPSACIDLTSNSQDFFPPTYVGGIDGNGTLYQVGEGAYVDFSECVEALCETCPTALSVPGTIESGTYQADVRVYSTGTVSVGKTVAFKAGSEVVMDAGFSVNAQADFSAEIEGCPNGN